MMKKPKYSRFWLPLLLTVLAGSGLYLFSRQPSADRIKRVAGAEKDAPAPRINMARIHQTHLSQGKKQWTLTADILQITPDGRTGILKNLVATRFPTAGEPVQITADKGVLNIKSNDLTISGNVVLEDGTYKICTPVLHYQNAANIIYTNAGVTINGDNLHLQGETIRYHLTSMEAVLTKNVQGVLKTPPAGKQYF